MEYDINQFKKPIGESGRHVINLMNDHHRGVTEWGISKIPDINPSHILDIGCGGGMCIGILEKKYSNAKITGIDLSEESVAATKEYNEKIIKEGRLEVFEYNVSNLPLEGKFFDLITAVETYFFWPDLKNDISKVSENLSKDGVFIIVSEMSYKDGNDEAIKKMNDTYDSKIIQNEIVAEYMKASDLDVQVITDEDSHWVAFVGKRID